MYTLVETLDCDLTMSMHACIVLLLKVVAQNCILRIKIPRSIYSWTRHHRPMWEDSFLKSLHMKSVFLLFSVCTKWIVVLSGGTRPRDVYFFLSTWLMLLGFDVVPIATGFFLQACNSGWKHRVRYTDVANVRVIFSSVLTHSHPTKNATSIFFITTQKPKLCVRYSKWSCILKSKEMMSNCQSEYYQTAITSRFGQPWIFPRWIILGLTGDEQPTLTATARLALTARVLGRQGIARFFSEENDIENKLIARFGQLHTGIKPGLQQERCQQATHMQSQN
jgi:hypothetical protein